MPFVLYRIDGLGDGLCSRRISTASVAHAALAVRAVGTRVEQPDGQPPPQPRLAGLLHLALSQVLLFFTVNWDMTYI
jgi:hypothetical protein